jgi:hypothetical protein
VTRSKKKRKKIHKSSEDVMNAFRGVDDIGWDAGDDDVDVSFGVFAIRELKEGEEIVIGWEWDDAHRIHRLPRLLLEEARIFAGSGASFTYVVSQFIKGLGD